MRPLYILLRFLIPYALYVYNRKTKTINSQLKFNAQTIFVCNHPSAFIDPMVAANYQLPVIYFVTRGDIFKKWLAPITWASQMVPIFRKAEDGADSFEKNKASFRYLRRVLKRKKSLILFGEGYTDNVFIRSLKPIKKGPARVGFDTMVEYNWEEDIKIQTISLNYSHPKHFRADVVIAMGEIINLKDYREQYEEKVSIAITKLTRDIQKSMQDNLTYVADKKLADFVENLLILSRKGMNHFHFDKSESLVDRYNFSRETATKINENYDEENEKWTGLNVDMESYFAEEKEEKINENWVANYAKNESKNMPNRILYLLLGFPIAMIGFIHNFIPYIITKKFVEKIFKRDVFWSGVKMFLGAFLALAYNLPFVFLFHTYVYESYLLGVLYLLIVPASTGVFAYNYFTQLFDTIRIGKVEISRLAYYKEKRAALLGRIKTLDIF